MKKGYPQEAAFDQFRVQSHITNQRSNTYRPPLFQAQQFHPELHLLQQVATSQIPSHPQLQQVVASQIPSYPQLQGVPPQVPSYPQLQTVQQTTPKQPKKRGRPRKKPLNQGEVSLQRSQISTSVPGYLAASLTGPQQFSQVVNSAPCSFGNNTHNQPPIYYNTPPYAASYFPPTYGAPPTNTLVAQRNWDQSAAQRARPQNQTVNTGVHSVNANASTQHLHHNYNLTSQTGAQHIANQYQQQYIPYFTQPSEQSNSFATSGSTPAYVEPLRGIEAIVDGINAGFDNRYQSHISNSNTRINNVYVNQPCNQTYAHPATISTYGASSFEVSPLINSAERVVTNINAPANNTLQNPTVNSGVATQYNSLSTISSLGGCTSCIETNLPDTCSSTTSNAPRKKRTRFKDTTTDVLNVPKKRAKTESKTSSSASKSKSTVVQNPSSSSDNNLKELDSSIQSEVFNTQPQVQETALSTDNANAHAEALLNTSKNFSEEEYNSIIERIELPSEVNKILDDIARKKLDDKFEDIIQDARSSHSTPHFSNNELALVTENNDAQLSQHQKKKNSNNFGACATFVSPHTRASPTETSGVAVETEFFKVCSAGERRSSSGTSPTAVQPPSLSSSTVATLPTAVGCVTSSHSHPNLFVPVGSNYGNAGGDNTEGFAEQFLLKQTPVRSRPNQQPYRQHSSPVLESIGIHFTDDILEVGPATEQLANTSPYIIADNSTATGEHQHAPTSDITSDMKYESQSGPPSAQPHMTSTGVEPPHSSQGPGMMVGSSPTDAEGVTVMLPTWNGGTPDYLDQSGIKQTTQSLSDTWDSLLIEQSLDVPQPQIAADRRPLPSFVGYTSHLSINGISGLHYHAIASSAQRSVIPSGSPTQSTNPEYYASVVPDTQEYQEPPVVSSSTPCQQGSQKQQQQQQQHSSSTQHCNPHQHHHHNHHQQQLPQSTQQIELDIEADIARLISNAIAADTTVSSGGSSGNDTNSANDGATGNGSNGGSSSLVQDQDTTSRHTSPWNDIVDWFDTACSTNKHQETNIYTVYSTSSPVQTQQHSSAIPNLLTYSPLLQARLQAGNAEAPSSTSTYPPVSPPGRVSTSGSPDQNLHSSYNAPSHSRKRSRGSQGAQNPAKKAAAAISYSNDASMAGGKEKPVHRCSICSRGFLNKSNIKVHLRTHTGEKPFKCTTCEKTFRQKAHLIKHQQIHKRGSRD
ncbi:uncharacterized protein LOC116840383 [Odontomachus brunneus]|uniref:uncharacterized protein LOC116840383 n=1 Tax=Odontomachus brunneus TaxID=486640 RepID=UPI0013F24163|nr:uncharacterized protein LOC116840383 [Odontomachus brunneus]